MNGRQFAYSVGSVATHVDFFYNKFKKIYLNCVRERTSFQIKRSRLGTSSVRVRQPTFNLGVVDVATPPIIARVLSCQRDP